jgi:hypothetical protein
MSIVKRLCKGKEVEIWMYDKRCWERVKLGDKCKDKGSVGDGEAIWYTISFLSNEYKDKPFPFSLSNRCLEIDEGWRYACHSRATPAAVRSSACQRVSGSSENQMQDHPN